VSRLRVSATVLLVTAAMAGCGGPEGGPVFDNEGGRPVECMAHQQEPPGSRYLDTQSPEFDTADLFAVLRYYTANGTKPFCDGAPATDADRAWAELYVGQTGARERVSTVLG
jgi:hypothetical protein